MATAGLANHPYRPMEVKVFADVVSQILLEEDLNGDRFSATGDCNCRNQRQSTEMASPAPLAVSSARILTTSFYGQKTSPVPRPSISLSSRTCDLLRCATPLLLTACEFGEKSSKNTFGFKNSSRSEQCPQLVLAIFRTRQLP
jgi:hypothetical protein